MIVFCVFSLSLVCTCGGCVSPCFCVFLSCSVLVCVVRVISIVLRVCRFVCDLCVIVLCVLLTFFLVLRVLCACSHVLRVFCVFYVCCLSVCLLGLYVCMIVVRVCVWFSLLFVGGVCVFPCFMCFVLLYFPCLFVDLFLSV